jgi:hypothetical protein
VTPPPTPETGTTTREPLFDDHGRRFIASSPRQSCPYGWCGEGTKGCRRPECIAHAKGELPAPLAPTPETGTTTRRLCFHCAGGNHAYHQQKMMCGQRLGSRRVCNCDVVPAPVAPSPGETRETDDALQEAKALEREWKAYKEGFLSGSGAEYDGLNYEQRVATAEWEASAYTPPLTSAHLAALAARPAERADAI